VRLVTFAGDAGPRLGALLDGDVVDLAAADSSLPAEMNALLAGGAGTLARARDVLVDPPAQARRPRASITLLAPVLRPPKLVCIGLNYRDHAIETGLELPTVPTVFAKYSSAITGSGAPIVLPRASEQIDFEAELAFVIGRGGRNIPAGDALQHVAGYTVFNDVTARDVQFQTTQWTLGKSFDTFAPMGPALVTSDEVADPHDLSIRLDIDGETMQESSTRELVFGVPDLVAFLSRTMTLEPGDVVATGTPAGVGYTREPPRFLRAGDRVRVEVEGLGVLENPVVS
jgi:2-keto-4-pentenoate hydratase/2-oxohepta-3-ene-1,7-dioic acid hydratase in catechol pathway